MLLLSDRSKDEPELEDIFRGCQKWVRKVVELHPSEDNDATYVFIVWTEQDRHDEVLKQIVSNMEGLRAQVQTLAENIIAVTEDVC